MKELLGDFRIRRLLLANITGSIGSGITIIAIPWLLVQRPDGDRLYGYITIASTILLFMLVPYYGAWLDRHSRKLALLAGETLGASVTLTMGVWIFLTGQTETWQLIILYMSGMLYYSLHYPAKFAFIQQIFAKRHYGQLIGLMEIQGQTATMLAGGLASLLLDHVPFHLILFADATTYLFSFLVQSTIPYEATHLVAGKQHGSVWKSMGEGLGWLRARPHFTTFVLCTMTPFVAIMIGNYLFPIYVQNILHAPASVFGRGGMACALGAMLGGIFGPRLIARYTSVNLAFAMMAIFIVGLVLLGSIQTTATFYLALIFLGLGNSGSRIARGNVVLHEVPNAIMGRVNVSIAAVERLMRMLLQFCAILLVIHADASWAFIGLVLFIGLALWLAYQSQKSLQASNSPTPSI